MKLGTVALAGLMTMGAIASTHLVIAQDNQPVPVESQQNDRRAAIARINPKKPIQIRVVSQTTVPVVASSVPAVGDRPVAPGKSVTLGRLHTSYLSLPLDLQVSLAKTPDPDQPIGVSLDVKTAGNEIIVGVKTSPTAVNSAQTINIDQKGLIYLY
ncbi:hypothetical protein AB3R30_09345 [Leptolyngbyaceae cyanobacterium UHCC 1019]